MSAPLELRRARAEARRRQREAKIVEPRDGWQRGFVRLLNGRCPWCDGPILNVSVAGGELSWACADGCNP